MYKNDLFIYIVHRLLEWYKEENPGETNDLSILKTMKLLFFVCAYSIEIDETKDQGNNLINIFNDFVAMPYGHVELEIYNNIQFNSELNDKISITKNTANINEGVLQHIIINNEDRHIIDKSIQGLKKYKLITKSASYLVDLSHQYYSWKYYYTKAKENSSRMYNIPIDILLKENKYFVL